MKIQFLYNFFIFFIKFEVVNMPTKNGTGPNKGSIGPRDGRGKGRGRRTTSTTKGTGRKKGGQKGNC